MLQKKLGLSISKDVDLVGCILQLYFYNHVKLTHKLHKLKLG